MLIKSYAIRFAKQTFIDLFHERLCNATKSSASEEKGTRPCKRHNNRLFLPAVARRNCGARVPVYETLPPVNTPIIREVSLSRAPICGATDSSAPGANATR